MKSCNNIIDTTVNSKVELEKMNDIILTFLTTNNNDINN